MKFFVIFALVGLVIVYINLKDLFDGKKGKFIALLPLLCIAFGMLFRETFWGSLLTAIFSVWICEALLLYIPWSIVKVIFFKKLFCKIKFISKIIFAITIAVTIGIFAYGIYNNANYKVNKATIKLNYAKNFTAVFFSDIHMAPLFKEQKLKQLIATVDSLKPDYILFGGDLADVSPKILNEYGYDTLFKQLARSAKIRALAINGNHERMLESAGKNPNEWMQNANFIVLDDSTFCDTLACFTGRTDFNVARGRGFMRKSLTELAPNIQNRTEPWILLDHQPKGIEPDYKGHVPDFAMSGHTHNGQFFPATVAIKFIWKLYYGLVFLDNVRWLVSSGFDCWGPPVRIGSISEIWIIEFVSD